VRTGGEHSTRKIVLKIFRSIVRESGCVTPWTQVDIKPYLYLILRELGNVLDQSILWAKFSGFLPEQKVAKEKEGKMKRGKRER
jgi:hypothetical protein